MLERLKRRKLVRWTLAYVGGAAALFGTLETVGQVFEWPAGLLRAVFFLLVGGLIATVVLTWYHGERGRQRVRPLELVLLLAAAAVGLGGASYSMARGFGVDPTSEPTSTASTDSIDPVAHEHYVRGEAALKLRTPAAVIQAIGEYRAASQLSPALTAAIAREAYAYALFVDWGWIYPGLPEAELLRRGTAASDRALAQDSTSPEAWLAHAYLLQLIDPDRLAAAAEAFGQAVRLDPSNAEAQHQYGQTLTALGRYPEAKAAYHAALALEPKRPLTLVPLSAIALREGDPSSASRWADSAVAMAPDAPYAWASRAQLRLGLGDPAGARSDAEHALRIDASYELPAHAALAAALAAMQDTAEAEVAMARARRAIVRPDRPTPTETYYLAIALLRMDRRREALDLIEATRPRSNWFWFYLQSPAFDALRADPRFERVVDSARPDPASPGG